MSAEAITLDQGESLRDEMRRARRRRAVQFARELIGHRSFLIGVTILLVFTLIAVLAPWIAPYDPNKNNYRDVMMPPSAQFWFGTDGFGRDVLSRVIYGTRVSLTIGLVVVAC
jgi:peptide/nickel transport system permease protein